MNKPLTAFLVAVILLPNVPAATIFVNGLAIPGGTGDAFGTSVNDGRLGFFPTSTTISSVMNGGPCRTAVPAAVP